MQLDVRPKANGLHIDRFLITHNGYELPSIKGGTYGTGGYTNLRKLFTPVNELLDFLGPAVQDVIFDEFEKIFQLLNNFTNIKDGTLDAVADCVTTMFEHIEPDLVIYFITNQKSSVFVPENTSDKIEEHHTQDKTYVAADYIPLIALGLSMQLLLPIWAMICTIVKDDVGTRNKELYCMSIINKSTIVETDGYKRLVRYIEALTNNVKIPLGVLVNKGLSELTLVKWALANAVVRKLATTEFSDPNTKVVNNIYSALDGKLKNLPGAFNVYSKDKHFYTRDTSNSQDESGNDSLLEDFKRTSKIPLGYRSALQNYVSDVERVMVNLIKASPNCDELMPRKDAIVREATELKEYLRKTGEHSISTYSLGVCAMLFKTQFHPVALHYVDYSVGFSVLLACAYVYIKEVGFKEPQLYLTALEEEEPNRANVRYSIAKETIDRIEACFPYTYDNPKLSQEQANPGRIHVTRAVAFMTQRFWIANLNRRQLNIIDVEENNSPLTPTTNFKEEYAQLLIHSQQLKYDVVLMEDILNRKY